VGLEVDVREWFEPVRAKRGGKRAAHAVPRTTVPRNLIESCLA
jgi:hypothetical protein